MICSCIPWIESCSSTTFPPPIQKAFIRIYTESSHFSGKASCRDSDICISRGVSNFLGAVIGVNGPAEVHGQPFQVSGMNEKEAPNRATEKPVEESFSSPGVGWNVNGKARKARKAPVGKVDSRCRADFRA